MRYWRFLVNFTCFSYDKITILNLEGDFIMGQTKVWTLNEELEMSKKALEYKNQGNMAEYERIMKSIPLAPYLAKIAKECFGAEFLLNGGWNLSEANEEFGADWLAR